MNKKGFTLVELLSVIIITGVLVAMAVPMYEKSVEKSRIVEARTELAKLLDAKLRAMDEREETLYTGSSWGMGQLDVAFPCTSNCSETTYFSTKNFSYSLLPGSSSISVDGGVGVSNNIVNAVCAKRLGGENAGTILLYLGELKKDTSQRFLCSGTGCANWGMSNTSGITCSTGS